jgi:hypothetical protein
MTQTQDLCPINDSGNHRYFIFRVVEVFELYKGSYDGLPIDATGARDGKLGTTLYEKVEYAISGCNCGSAMRQKVKQQ